MYIGIYVIHSLITLKTLKDKSKVLKRIFLISKIDFLLFFDKIKNIFKEKEIYKMPILGGLGRLTRDTL